MIKKLWLPCALALLASAFLAPTIAAEKMSAIVPMEDLIGEIKTQMTELEANLADESKFKKKANARACGVLAALIQAVVEHDGEDNHKKTAPDLRDAILAVGKAETAADAKKAFENVKKIDGAKPTAKAEYDWSKFVDVHNLMEEVQSRNAKLAKVIRKGTQDADSVRHSMVLAVLGVALEANPHNLKDKKDIENWKQYSKDFATGFAGLTTALKTKEADKVKAAFSTVGKSCAACHEKYKE